MCRLGIHSTKRYGPVPTYWVTGPAGVASAISFGMIAAAEEGRARKASRGANGSFRLMTTVYLSGAVTASTWLKTTMPREPTFPQRTSDATTSSDVISLPLWKSTRRRSLKVCVRPFELMAWDSTSIGWGRQLASKANGVSTIAVVTSLVTPTVVAE